jgi:hypothetical protein
VDVTGNDPKRSNKIPRRPLSAHARGRRYRRRVDGGLRPTYIEATGQTSEEWSMSDLKRIQEARTAERNDANEEERRLKALEDIADALEGIRQDLKLITDLLARPAG